MNVKQTRAVDVLMWGTLRDYSFDDVTIEQVHDAIAAVIAGKFSEDDAVEFVVSCEIERIAAMVEGGGYEQNIALCQEALAREQAKARQFRG